MPMLPLAVWGTPLGVLVVVTLVLALVRLWRGSRPDPDVRAEADALTRYWTDGRLASVATDHTLEFTRPLPSPLDDRTTMWPRPAAAYRNPPPRASVWPASSDADRPAWATALTAATLHLFNTGDDIESTHAFDAGEVFDVMSRADVDTQANAFFHDDPLNALSLPLDLELPTFSVDTFVDLVHAGQLTGSLNDNRSLGWIPWGFEQQPDPEDDETDDDELDRELDEMTELAAQPALAGAH